MMRNPLLIAGALAAGVCGIIAVAFAVRGGGGDVAQSAPAEYTGDPVSCATVPGPRSLYAMADGHFHVVGWLQSFQDRQFVVKGPRGPVSLVLADDAKVEGTYLSGDAMDVSGDSGEDGILVAREVSPVCPVTPTSLMTQAPLPPPTEPPVTPAPAQPVFPQKHANAGAGGGHAKPTPKPKH